MTLGEQLVVIRTAGKKKNPSKTMNVCLKTLFSSVKTPPLIRTEDELKQKIALLEVWSMIAFEF